MSESRAPRGQGAASARTGPRSLLFGLVGIVLGGVLGGNLWGALSGAAIGLLIGNGTATQKRVAELLASMAALQDEQRDLERRLLQRRPDEAATGPEARTRPSAAPAEGARTARPPSAAAEPPEEGLEDAVASAFARRAAAAAGPGASEPAPAPAAEAREPGVVEQGLAAVRNFFFGGNTVVRVGLLVLLVGLTLLAKYAADNALFPVEARLATAALIGLGLTVFGYRQRTIRPGFGLSLQGGGIAALYLVVFFAFRFYELVPAALAFAFFVALAISTGILSVLQASQPLLIIGSLGGFLAPILASTGEGNHVALFSYYLLLIAATAAVAWSRAWRLPAIVAFVSTYGIATTWGVLRYDEALFASTEPFVLAFMALFTAIAILHAWRRPPRLRGFVDGTLVFGTPLVSLLLQGHLVREMELGLALSAAGFGLFYAGLATWLWHAAPREVRPLSEAFIALAVGFGTMAIPFTFDQALTTSIAWALEGAGLYWIGARTMRLLPRLSGVALQALSGIAFLVGAGFEGIDSSAFLPIANGRALSCLALAGAGLFIAQQAFVKRARMSVIEMQLAQALGVWGLLWWTGGVIAEVDQFVLEDFHPAVLVGITASTALALELIGERRDWEPGRWMAWAALPAGALLLLGSLEHHPQLLADAGWLAWPALFATLYLLWARRVDAHPEPLALLRAGSLWLLALVSGFAGMGLAGEAWALAIDWELAGFGVGVAAVLLGALWLHARRLAPCDRAPRALLLTGLGPITALALLFIAWLQLAARGEADPLPHVPLLNPADGAAGLLGLGALFWWQRLAAALEEPIDRDLRLAWIVGVAALAFLWLNGLLVRAVHQWTGVRFDPEALWDSVALQVSLSIAWTLVALVGMLLSSRYGWRQTWLACAGLLGVVVVKLFAVDLSQLSTVARIGTFLAVGGLLLVLGYLSPVPPGEEGLPGAAAADEPEGAR